MYFTNINTPIKAIFKTNKIIIRNTYYDFLEIFTFEKNKNLSKNFSFFSKVF